MNTRSMVGLLLIGLCLFIGGRVDMNEVRGMWPPGASLGPDASIGPSLRVFELADEPVQTLWSLADTASVNAWVMPVVDADHTVGTVLARGRPGTAAAVERVSTGDSEYREYLEAIRLVTEHLGDSATVKTQIVRTEGWSLVVARKTDREVALFCNVIPGGLVYDESAIRREPPKTIMDTATGLGWVEYLTGRRDAPALDGTQ